MAGAHEEGPSTNPQVLTEDEAVTIQNNVSDYFDESRFLRGVHRTEIVADAMLREGLVDLAGDLMEIHADLKRILAGKFKEGFFIAENSNVISDFIGAAQKTKFSGVAPLLEGIEDIDKIFHGNERGTNPNWDYSIPTLEKVREERFPDNRRRAKELEARSLASTGRQL